MDRPEEARERYTSCACFGIDINVNTSKSAPCICTNSQKDHTPQIILQSQWQRHTSPSHHFPRPRHIASAQQAVQASQERQVPQAGFERL